MLVTYPDVCWSLSAVPCALWRTEKKVHAKLFTDTTRFVKK